VYGARLARLAQAYASSCVPRGVMLAHVIQVLLYMIPLAIHDPTVPTRRRNRRVAEAYTRAIREGKPRTFEDLEAELLRGQKLQGVLTSNEVQEVLRVRDWEVRRTTTSTQRPIARTPL